MKPYSTQRSRIRNRALFAGLCLLLFSAVSSCGDSSEEEKATVESSQSSSNSNAIPDTNSTESENTETAEAAVTEPVEAAVTEPVEAESKEPSKSEPVQVAEEKEPEENEEKLVAAVTQEVEPVKEEQAPEQTTETSASDDTVEPVEISDSEVKNQTTESAGEEVEAEVSQQSTAEPESNTKENSGVAESQASTDQEDPANETAPTENIVDATAPEADSLSDTKMSNKDESLPDVSAKSESSTESEGAGWRAVQADPGCCGTGCATACSDGEEQAMAANVETEAATTIVAAMSDSTAESEGAGWRAVQGDPGCCGTGCATACEDEVEQTATDTAEDTVSMTAASEEKESMSSDGAGWRAIQGDTECCGTGCAAACEPGPESAMADTTETSPAPTAASTAKPVSEGAGWRAIQGDTECCGTGCATACESGPESSMTDSNESTSAPTTSETTSTSEGAGWRAIEGDTECCGTGCATACESGEESSSTNDKQSAATASASNMTPTTSEGAGWRSLQGDTECCGTGCAKACSDAEASPMTENDETASASTDSAMTEPAPEPKTMDAEGWRAIQGDTECCGTGCAVPCGEQESSSTEPQKSSSSIQQVTDSGESDQGEQSQQSGHMLKVALNVQEETNSDHALYTVVDGKVDEKTWIGSKIYQRVFGRGCGTCHDVQSNPDLTVSLKTIERDEFAEIMRHGKNNGKMPVTIDSIMTLGPVKKAQLTETEAIDAIYAYLRGRALGDIPAGRVNRIN